MGKLGFIMIPTAMIAVPAKQGQLSWRCLWTCLYYVWRKSWFECAFL